MPTESAKRGSYRRSSYRERFVALDRAIFIALEGDEGALTAIGDAYRHLLGDCNPELCELCGDDSNPK